MQGYWDALRVQATPGAPPWLCVQTPSNPGPLPKASSFAACSLGLDGAVCCLLAYERLMRRCECGAYCRSCGSLGLLAEDGMRSHRRMMCRALVRSIIPARGAEELWLSSWSSTPLVDVFIFLLWSETNARSDQ